MSLILNHSFFAGSLLGDTIEKIAWQKAGIMKPNRTTFIDDDQPEVGHLIMGS